MISVAQAEWNDSQRRVGYSGGRKWSSSGIAMALTPRSVCPGGPTSVLIMAGAGAGSKPGSDFPRPLWHRGLPWGKRGGMAVLVAIQGPNAGQRFALDGADSLDI